ncbi:MAG: universal stress protein [Candidatus Methanomethylophilaceae archaeon]|jgi:nucleotide-binding universal stress UspA family protein|nr:universal stress protein [Candidatus Methanomethylophilaceae archaeon]NCA74479.1 universal stress protein [Gammaproteobacteria bacterium]MDD2936300.1 universal stress protein [Candidatus Methanomethylophilaceae archaeon]MDD3351893.1 universal stress protein [Candidatus Methanomethylophilaceae archaeon]MDD3987220.1 universal stress protein [Candidatus Methanomethylophilaceae archaeon]
MVFDKILVPTDGSEYTKAAVRRAMDLAKLSSGKITALYVMDQTIFTNVPMDTAVMNVYRTLEKEGKNALQFVEELGREAGVSVEIKLAEGIPIKVILELSKEYDVIVMGTLGRTGMSKLLMGSVAERVVRASRCPVMVVRSPEADKQ